jgi:hypothetical protein
VLKLVFPETTVYAKLRPPWQASRKESRVDGDLAPSVPSGNAAALVTFLDRALADPELLAEFKARPLRTLHAAQVRLSIADFKPLFHLQQATDTEMLEVLLANLLPALTSDSEAVADS